LSWLALIFAPTAATAGMLAQMIHIINSFTDDRDYKIFIAAARLRWNTLWQTIRLGLRPC
jgi:hypothetical protein